MDTGAGDVEGAGPPNEKAFFDGSVIAGAETGAPKENADLDGSAAGAETAGVPKLNDEAEGLVPKSDGGLLVSGSVVFGASLAGAGSTGAGGAPNENGKEDGAGVGAEGNAGE